MQKHFPTRAVGCAFCINSTHHTLHAKLSCNFVDELWTLYRRCIHTHLVGTGAQDSSRIFKRTNATTHRERNKHFSRCALNHIDHGVAVVGRCSDIEKHQFIGALEVIPRGKFNRVTCIAQVNKVHAFHHAAFSDIETRNNACNFHHCPPAFAAAIASATVKRFS